MSKDRTIHQEKPPAGGLEAKRSLLPLRAGAAAEVNISHPTGEEAESCANAVAEGEAAEASQSGRRVGAKSASRSLPSRNIVVDGKRTSVRLDAFHLRALYDAAERERISVNELCTLIQERGRLRGYTLTAAIRIHIMSYFQSAATDEGHRLAGHGCGYPLAGTPFDPVPSTEMSAPQAPRRRRTRNASSGEDKTSGRPRRAAGPVTADEAVAN
jgi:predicted DNA-binding ribbon-helix-helix protein